MLSVTWSLFALLTKEKLSQSWVSLQTRKTDLSRKLRREIAFQTGNEISILCLSSSSSQNPLAFPLIILFPFSPMGCYIHADNDALQFFKKKFIPFICNINISLFFFPLFNKLLQQIRNENLNPIVFINQIILCHWTTKS